MRGWWIAAVGLLGCGGSLEEEDNFIEQAAIENCRISEKCYLAGYLESYSDMDDCIDENIEDFEDLADFFDDIDCDYDPDGARDCIDALREAMTCEDNDLEDAYEACFEDSYDC